MSHMFFWPSFEGALMDPKVLRIRSGRKQSETDQHWLSGNVASRGGHFMFGFRWANTCKQLSVEGQQAQRVLAE